MPMNSDSVQVTKLDSATVRLRFFEAVEGFQPKATVTLDWPLGKVDKLIHELGTLKNMEPNPQPE